MGLFLLLLATAGIAAPQETPKPFTPAPGHWPQWRGPNRDNVSTETGLLREWPEGGPKLLWKSADLGEGFPPVSVAGGRIYGIGYREKFEFVTALDGDGRVFWTQAIGPHAGEFQSMRYLSQRSITVDDDRLYAFTAEGRLLCLQTSDGKILWERSYPRDFGGTGMSFFYADAPLVDGDLLICKPGGPKGMLVAMNKRTFEVVWRSAELQGNAAHAPVIAAEIGDVRQYIVLCYDCVAGIESRTGRLLWSAKRHGSTALAPTPICRDGIVFVTSGFGRGHNAFQITVDAGRMFQAKEVYSGGQMENNRGGGVLVGDHLFGTDYSSLKCMEFKTGTVVWMDRCVGKGYVTAGDGRLYVWGESGAVSLVDASPSGYAERGRFTPPDRSKEPTSQPVVAGGRLYLRDINLLYCYDLRSPEYKEPSPVWASPPAVGNPRSSPPRPSRQPEPREPEEKVPDAAFVATPQDVVDKMVEAAKITKDDVVYDLGSGDGRIVITAARNHGCKAVGFEIKPGLVWESRFKLKQQKLDGLVTIEEKDLFTADLEPASVIMLYLGAPNNARLLPKLRKLKPGSRIVSHAHLLGDGGPKPDRELKVVSTEDQAEHTIYVWTTPLKEAGK